MDISSNIIIGSTISHKAEKILKIIRFHKKVKDILWYGITTSLEAENLLYLMPGIEFRQEVYNNPSIRLLGIAGSKDEAEDIVMKLIADGYTDGEIQDMKTFLENY